MDPMPLAPPRRDTDLRSRYGVPPRLPSRHNPPPLVRSNQRQKNLENLDNKPAGARHPDHKRRLARRIDSGRKRARHLARQGICNRAFQPAVAPLHRNGSARKFVGPEIGGVVVGIVPRASRKLVRKAALEHVVRRSLSVVRSSQIPTRGQLRYFAIVPTMLFKQTIRQLGSESF